MLNQSEHRSGDPAIADEYSTVRVPAEVYPYAAGIYGGLLGGLGMIPFAVIYGLLSGNGVWYPVNLIAATVIRDWQLAAPGALAQFSVAGVALGLLIHVVMATSLGLTFAVVLPTLPGTPRVWALIVGPLLWASAVFVGLPLLNPVMARLVDYPSFALANITYSLILGFWVARTPKIPAG